jgi:uncharacterized DUF497 family protein
MDFRWNDWNLEHVGAHGVTPEEAEFIVAHAARPYPERIEEKKYLVLGLGWGGRFIQAVYLLDDEGTACIIHARPLTEAERRRLRRREP